MKECLMSLRSLGERTGITQFLQGYEEGARVTLGQLRGPAVIAQLIIEDTNLVYGCSPSARTPG